MELKMWRDFPGSPVVKTLYFRCRGSVPGQGTKIPRAASWSQKKKRCGNREGQQPPCAVSSGRFNFIQEKASIWILYLNVINEIKTLTFVP